MAGYFYPLPPTNVGGRQPYAPRMGIAQSGETPQSPPVRSLAVLSLILGTLAPQAYALPSAAKIAPFIPAAVADNPPVSRKNFEIIRAQLAYEPTTIIFVSAIAPTLQTPAIPDNPPVRTYVNFNGLITSWRTVHRSLPSTIKLAPLLPAPAVPDNPPVSSYANRNLILAQWIPPYIPLPKLQISATVTFAPPALTGQIPNLSAAFNSGTHQFDLSIYATGQTSYSISPALEAGWSLNTSTGELVIDTDDEGTFGPYVLTFTNPQGDTDSNGFTVKVSTSTIRPYRGIRGSGGLRNYS